MNGGRVDTAESWIYRENGGDTWEVSQPLLSIPLYGHPEITATSPATTGKKKKKKSTSTQKCFLNCQTLELAKRPLQSWAAPWPLSPASGQVPAPFLLLFRNIWEIRLPLPSSFDILSGLETKLLCFPSLGGSVQSRLFGKHSCYLCFLVSPTVTPLCF